MTIAHLTELFYYDFSSHLCCFTMSAWLMLVALAALAAVSSGCHPCSCQKDVMYCAGLHLMEVPEAPASSSKIRNLSLQVRSAILIASVLIN